MAYTATGSGGATGTDATASLKDEKIDYISLGQVIEGRLKSAETTRLYDEKRWLRAYRNYRGIYSSDMAFRDTEKSRVFVKITKTKVLAAYGQLIEVLFSQGKFPIGIHPTEIPEGAEKYAHLNPEEKMEEPESPYGFPGDGMDIPPGATESLILNGLAKKYEGA